jgi:CheY-like chemotaxis protein
LLLETGSRPSGWLPPGCVSDCEIVRVAGLGQALDLLRNEHFDGFFADTHDSTVWQRAASLIQAERILNTLLDGVAVVNPERSIVWANAAFEKWAGGSVVGREFYEALGSPDCLGPDDDPFRTALSGKMSTTRLHGRDNRYIDLDITPIHEANGQIGQLIALGRDVTAEVNQQQKLNALHQAGRELAPNDLAEVAELGPEQRIELLKINIRRLTHDLLHYDVIEIRLLDPRTGKLEPLLEEGMSEAAAKRVLYARLDGNGVTGLVAATAKSYLCRDTSTDPHYLQGALGARSSLTVPLLVDEQIIGTLNVESPLVNAFSEDDRQFLEMFGREIASALHTLDLLSAEKQSTTSKSVEAISREVALPVDEILRAATAILDRYIGHDPALGERLRQILVNARAIKQCIQKVGEDLACTATMRPAEPAHPRLRGLRILLADNDERVRRSAHATLGRLGCIVETAGDGQEALTMARLSSYDVILADIRLPDINGYDIFRRLRQAQPQARVVLMTAYGYDPSHAIVKARQEGLRSVLYKPFRIDQLIEVLDKPDTSLPTADASAPAAGSRS